MLGDKNRALRAAPDGEVRGIEIDIGIVPRSCGAVVGAAVATGTAGAAGVRAFVEPPPPQPAIASVETRTARRRVCIRLRTYWTVTGRVAEFGTH